MSRPSVIETPDIDLAQTGGGSGWIVTVFDNDTNTEDEVIEILIQATKCPLEEAQMETWEVHHLGKSVVHHGSQSECEGVSAIISQIGIRVEVSEE